MVATAIRRSAVVLTLVACDHPAPAPNAFAEPCPIYPSDQGEELHFPIAEGATELAAATLVEPDAVFFTDRYEPSLWRWSPRASSLTQVARSGSGPGEFRMIGGVSTDLDGRVQVVDRANRTVSLLTGEGAFVRRVQIPSGMGFHHALGPFEGGVWVYAQVRPVNMNGREGRATDSVDVFAAAEDEAPELLATFPGGVQYWDLRERFDVLQVPFSPSFFIGRVGDEVVVGASESRTLTVIDPVLRTMRSIGVPLAGVEVTEDMLRDHRERVASKARNADAVRDLHRRAGVWADSTPSYSQMLTDGVATILLKSYTQTDSSAFIALTPDGTIVNRWAVDRDLNPVAMSPVSIALVETNSDETTVLRIMTRSCDGAAAH